MASRIPRIVSLALLAGCTAEGYRRQADEATLGVVREKQREALGAERPFTIEPKQGSLREQVLGPRTDPVPPGPRSPVATEPLALTLATALEIAAENSRGFQDEKEKVYRAALDLTGARHNFESRYFGTVSGDSASSGLHRADTKSASQSSNLGFTRMLKTGGSVVLAIGNNLSRVFTGTNPTNFSTFYSLAISLPLLRNAGRDVAEEDLRQAERDALYAVRTFEQFKKEFVVTVVSDYLEVLRTLDEATNEENNLRSVEQTRERNEALGLAGRLSSVEVDQARQNSLNARNRAVQARAQFGTKLNEFLETIGLPPDLPAEVPRADLDDLPRPGGERFALEEARALAIAFRDRLDFANGEAAVADARRKVVVKASALKPGLDLVASAGDAAARPAPLRYERNNVDTSLGVDLDLPFDRVFERNAYRKALIDLEAARREAARQEDRIKIDVLTRLRDLEKTRQTFAIQDNAVALARRRVESARDFQEAGRASTRDLLEAQNAFVEAQNALTSALVDYTVSRLSLFRDLGVLQVSPEGLNYEATDALLRED
ncbi:MAG TPA: TolC family protein [Planctomycetota bacterium]|jgi:outer membrane protein TolC|nr:TolC family protein [Planctomycetota bacterium]